MNSSNFLRTLSRIVLAASAGATFVACGGATEVDLLRQSDAGTDAKVANDAGTDDASKPDAACVEAPKLLKHDGCSETFQLTCGLPAEYEENKGLPQDVCDRLCKGDGGAWSSGCFVTDPVAVTLQCYSCVEGRRPAGLRGEGALASARSLGSYFAHAAFLEVASIDAFYILRDELRVHGAPSSLVARAARAAGDEIRHARAMGALAARFGARVPDVNVAHGGARSLEAIATENAVEGCVRETYGALVAAWQASHALDTKIRAVMARVAKDEARHAALAWAVDAWIMGRLDDGARARVEQARNQAAKELARDVHVAPSPEMLLVAGLPSAEDASRLVTQMFVELLPSELCAAA